MCSYLGEEGKCFLVVVVIDKLPINAFRLVLLLLQLEELVVEELVHTLIGIIDAELLEAV